jgi:bifunctional DNase/RNase
MKKIEVKILGLSYSQSQMGSYVVVLSAKKGGKKLPIIIKPAEAQQIAMKVEGLKSQRPLTHDLFFTLASSFSIDLQQVFIYSIAEGIFYTKLITSNGVEEVEIDCCVGDGLALALSFGSPIFVSKEVLDSAGIEINDDGSLTQEDEAEAELVENVVDENPKKKKAQKSSVVSVEDLEKMMEEAIASEQYEIAAELRDRIQMLKDKQAK